MAARILLLEDDTASRELVKYLLENRGYAFQHASNGSDGVAQALHFSPDLIICDLQMPEMNGYDVIRQLLQEPSWRKTPVIAVTAFSRKSDRDAALAAGFSQHITKPIDPETFVASIEAFLPVALLACPPNPGSGG